MDRDVTTGSWRCRAASDSGSRPKDITCVNDTPKCPCQAFYFDVILENGAPVLQPLPAPTKANPNPNASQLPYTAYGLNEYQGNVLVAVRAPS